MSSPHSLPVYKAKYFETKSLDRIHGKPTLPQIIKIFRQLKRNAQRIPTRLGGGKHGYLALLYETAKYLSFTGTANFNRPRDPGSFAPTNITVTPSTGPTTRASYTADSTTTTAPTSRPPNSSKLAQQKATFDERLRLFLEVETVETILRNDLLAVFDGDYTQALRDATDMINLSIPDIIKYLVKNYGKMKPEELRECKKEVEITFMTRLCQ